MPRQACTVLPLAALPLAALIGLSACGDGKGTSISINSSDADGNITFGTDANGQVAIDTPVFKGKFTLPKLKLDATSFDMNGVHLYPGSTISGMNVDAHDDPRKTDDDGRVRVTFASPATPATVRDWFKDKLNAAKFTVSADGAGLVGKTDQGKPFKLGLAADGADKSNGVITIG